ncbi:MAG TPA: hypothetical protein VFH64_11000 [Amnibacterium sp.]|nr:hypothetical protein [Amnibacterium sp.]
MPMPRSTPGAAEPVDPPDVAATAADGVELGTGVGVALSRASLAAWASDASDFVG